MIQIFTTRGRSFETKQSLYANINAHLAAVGVAGTDVFIGYVENRPEGWSFSFVAAQYITGKIVVPASGAE